MRHVARSPCVSQLSQLRLPFIRPCPVSSPTTHAFHAQPKGVKRQHTYKRAQTSLRRSICENWHKSRLASECF
eukprot:6186715-Pleurochrysis_carterae.AAC.1